MLNQQSLLELRMYGEEFMFEKIMVVVIDGNSEQGSNCYLDLFKEFVQIEKSRKYEIYFMCVTSNLGSMEKMVKEGKEQWRTERGWKG